MGKKLSQASLKISKNENEKKQLHSLIKVLRPKVYITDSSSFKRLVQELTGNASSIPSSPPTKPDVVPIIDIKDGRDLESSMEASFASLDSSELCHQVPLSEEFNQACNQVCLDGSALEDPMVNPEVDTLAYREIESWLLEAEPYPFHHDYHFQIGQEVSIYDYELSGLI